MSNERELWCPCCGLMFYSGFYEDELCPACTLTELSQAMPELFPLVDKPQTEPGLQDGAGI